MQPEQCLKPLSWRKIETKYHIVNYKILRRHGTILREQLTKQFWQSCIRVKAVLLVRECLEWGILHVRVPYWEVIEVLASELQRNSYGA